MYKRPTNVNVMVWCHVDNVLKNITSVDTGSDWMLSFILKFNLISKILDSL